MLADITYRKSQSISQRICRYFAGRNQATDVRCTYAYYRFLYGGAFSHFYCATHGKIGISRTTECSLWHAMWNPRWETRSSVDMDQQRYDPMVAYRLKAWTPRQYRLGNSYGGSSCISLSEDSQRPA